MPIQPVGTWTRKHWCELFLWAWELIRVPEVRWGKMRTCSARSCQHGQLCSELMSGCVPVTTWNGWTSPLGVVSAEPPICSAWLPWVPLLMELEGGRDGGREGTSGPVAPPGAQPWLLHHASGCTRWHFKEPKHRGKANVWRDVCGGLEWKLLASQHWNLSFLFSLSVPFSCLSCCLWPD